MSNPTKISQKRLRNLAIILLVALSVIIVISPSQITDNPMLHIAQTY